MTSWTLFGGVWPVSTGGVSIGITPRLRQAILDFDPAVQELSVRGFCHSIGVSTSAFYKIRADGLERGRGAALRPRSRAPLKPARRYQGFTTAAICRIREELTQRNREAGPKSVQWRMFQEGIEPVPSESTIARTLRAHGLSEPTPSKRPRSSWQRFQRQHANELWQLDGIDWQLEGQLVTIYQIIDDCTRFQVGLLARFGGETHDGAKAALTTAINRAGKPVTLLTDNGSAFNQHRRGRLSATELWLAGQGIRPVSGRVGHPRTQGKVERSHQPLQRWLDHANPATLDQLQHELDRFDDYYNHERQHQGLKQSWTPAMAWNAASKADPPTTAIPPHLLYPGRDPLVLPPRPANPETTTRICSRHNHLINYRGRRLRLGWDMIGKVGIILTEHQLELYDRDGVLNAVIPWPQPGNHIIKANRPPFRVVPKVSTKS